MRLLTGVRHRTGEDHYGIRQEEAAGPSENDHTNAKINRYLQTTNRKRIF